MTPQYLIYLEHFSVKSQFVMLAEEISNVNYIFFPSILQTVMTVQPLQVILNVGLKRSWLSN